MDVPGNTNSCNMSTLPMQYLEQSTGKCNSVRPMAVGNEH